MTVTVLQGDCRDVLRTLPDESVHCVVTSPPYFGLRDYGVDGQIGLEATPSDYVAALVHIFREVRRVLRSDGTVWLNLGDSYQNAKGQSGGFDPKQPARRHLRSARPQDRAIPGLKPKDLIGVPWLAAFALREDGWHLRQEIIWSKPAPMPESVKDRCTRAHEHVFMLSKSARYYYDAEAIAEDAVYSGLVGQDSSGFKDPKNFGGKHGQRERGRPNGAATYEKFGHNTSCGTPEDGKRNKRSVWTIATKPFAEAHFATMAPELAETCVLAGCPVGGTVLDPFGGAGTTALVADRLQRNATIIELNPDYVRIAKDRLAADAGMFSQVA